MDSNSKTTRTQTIAFNSLRKSSIVMSRQGTSTQESLVNCHRWFVRRIEDGEDGLEAYRPQDVSQEDEVA